MTVTGGAGDVTDAPGMDAAVAGLSATSISTALATGSGTPNAGGLGIWSSAGFIQTRPTGVKMAVLMATLRNDAGHDLPSVIVSYTLTVAIPVTEQLLGHMVYYSLDGTTWTQIPSLSNQPGEGVAGTYSKSTTITFSSPWTSGSLLYLLFADDNGSGSPDNANQIDNFSIQLSATPPAITTQPRSQTNGEYSVTVLSVAESGTGPFTYQWYKNNTAISGATAASLVLTNTGGNGIAWSIPSDTGNYFVTVAGQSPPTATSQVARVVILADTNAPHFNWALVETNATGGTTVRVRLSETVVNPADLSEVLNWTVDKVSGPGSGLDAPDSVTITNNDILLIYDAATIDPATTYMVNYTGAPLTDRAQTPNTQTQFSVPVLAHTTDVVPMTAIWKYNDTVTSNNTAPTWFLPGFDDSDASLWKSGAGPFDSKRDANGAAGVHCRDTTLYGLGPVGTCINRTNVLTGQTNSVVFFRTHFTFTGSDPTNAALLLNGKFDDGAIVYLNGSELERVGVPSGSLSWVAFTTSRTVGDAEGQDTATIFPGALLHTGDNVLAVELHQQSDTSSDLTMGLNVEVATIEPATGGGSGPTLHISRNATTGQITITWSGAGTLQQTTDLGPTASWSNVTTTSPYTFTPAAGAGHLFFRVQQ